MTRPLSTALPERTNRRPVKSAVRALEVLSLFSREQKRLSQSEIVQKLSYPQSSTTFLLKSLVECGYLSYDREQRKYLPTPEVLTLGHWLHDLGYDAFFRKSVITKMLDELREISGETVYVATQNDIFVQYHRVLAKNRSVSLSIPEGTMLPLTYCADGYVLLSSLPTMKADRICRLINARECDPTQRLAYPKVTDQLSQIRERGYFYLRSSHLRGAGSIAMLLPVAIAGRPVAVGIGGMADRIERELNRMRCTLQGVLRNYSDELAMAFTSDS
jgi:DNA-binding IclR family transcriptional regulator